MSKIDSQVVIAGPQGAGKTSLLKELVATHVKAGAMVFVMDCHKQFAETVPWFPTVGHYVAHNRRAAADGQGAPRMLGAAAIGSQDSEELTDFVLALSEKLEAIEGPKPPYIALCYDEAVLIEGLLPSHIPMKMSRLIAMRRHRGIALSILCQDFGQLHQRWQTLATDLYMFRTSSEDRIKICAKRFGVKKESLELALAALPFKYHYLHIREEALVPR